MPARPKPPAEVAIDAALVRHLLADQHPDLADRPLVEVSAGWDNAIFRLGDDLVVRLPRRQMAAGLVAHEQQALPQLAPRLPLPIPVPVRTGRPAGPFPWHWSICPWLPGRPATVAPPRDLRATAELLGRFLRALHAPAPADAPANPYRGGPLADRDAVVRQRVDTLHDLVAGPAVLACWDGLVTTRPHEGPPVWLHGDLHPANLLVDGGRLAAVIDFGDVTAGDPATDLAVAWMLLPPAERAVLRAAAGEDDDTWRRARAWALSLSLAYLEHSADEPGLGAVGRRTLDAVVADG